MRFLLGILAVAFGVLTFISSRQASAAHCYAGFRDCIAECNASAPGSGGGASLECLTSCNAFNATITSQGEECVKQEMEQTEESQQPIPTNQETEQEQEDVILESPLPKPQAIVKRLTAGVDIKQGETVTAKKGEVLFVDFPGGSFVEVNSGASFTYKESDAAITFENLAGSIRYFFEHLAKDRNVQTSTVVATVRGTDFVVNEDNGKSEILVFDGKLAVSDKNGQNTVEVEKGYKTEAISGGKPATPVPIDFTKVDRWFDEVPEIPIKNSQTTLTKEKWAVVAGIVIGGLVIIFFCMRIVLKRAREKSR